MKTLNQQENNEQDTEEKSIRIEGYKDHQTPKTVFQRRLKQLSAVTFCICFVLCLVFARINGLYSCIFVGVMLSVFGVTLAFSEKTNVILLFFSDIGLSMMALSCADLWLQEPLCSSVRHFTYLAAMLVFIMIQIAAIIIAVYRHAGLNKVCFVPVSARCVGISYKNETGERGIIASVCPDLQFEYEGTQYFVCDGVFSVRNSKKIKTGATVLVNINPDDPNEFYRPDVRDTARHVRHSIYAIIITGFLFVMMIAGKI